MGVTVGRYTLPSNSEVERVSHDTAKLTSDLAESGFALPVIGPGAASGAEW